MVQLNKILVPIDFSECSDAALEYAAAIAEPFAAAIHVLHVWSPPDEIGPLMGGVALSAASADGHEQTLAELSHTQAGQSLHAVLQRLEAAGLRQVRGRLETGRPHRTIVRVADEEGYDLIVMGTHCDTGIAHVLISGVAEKVVRNAQVPVLTVPAPGGEDVPSSLTVPSTG